MKRVYYSILIAVTSAVWWKCSTDFQLTTGGIDQPAVYSLLNVKDSFHYVRVERVFVDENIPPADLAKDENEVFYNSIIVEMQVVDGDTFQLEKIDASAIDFPRDTGIFLQSPNVLYRIAQSEIDLEVTDSIIIQVKDAESDRVIAFAGTSIVGESVLSRPAPNDNDVKLAFLPRRESRYRWVADDDAVFFDFNMILYISEEKEGETNTVEYMWQVANGWNENFYDLNGDLFFSYIQNNLEVDPFVERELDSIKVVIGSGGMALRRFIDVNNLNLGITSSQVTPTYTNVEGGYGLVSSSDISSFPAFEVSPATLDTLASGRFIPFNFQ